MPLEALKRIEVAGTAIKECFLLVPIAEPPYFGRQRCKFPAVPLADIAPAAAEVASSTLGTGMHGVVRSSLFSLRSGMHVYFSELLLAPVPFMSSQ